MAPPTTTAVAHHGKRVGGGLPGSSTIGLAQNGRGLSPTNWASGLNMNDAAEATADPAINRLRGVLAPIEDIVFLNVSITPFYLRQKILFE